MNNEKDNFKFKVTAILTLVVIGLVVFKFVAVNRVRYEYYRNGKFKTSKNCYQTLNGKCYCDENGKFVEVDSYYENK